MRVNWNTVSRQPGRAEKGRSGQAREEEGECVRVHRFTVITQSAKDWPSHGGGGGECVQPGTLARHEQTVRLSYCGTECPGQRGGCGEYVQAPLYDRAKQCGGTRCP